MHVFNLIMLILGVKGGRRPAPKADNLTNIYVRRLSRNVGSSKSDDPMGLHGLLQG
jgi:hypothetical protein